MENEKKKQQVAEASELGRQGYEASVQLRMQNRIGAYTPYGAKGIAHEVMANDVSNVKNLFENPGAVTKLTKSSNAPQVDAVTMRGNKVVGRYQYKDTVSTSGINKTINQVKSGKYQQVQLRGTKETTELYNRLASQKGISKTMESTGISSKTTERIGDKFLGKTPKLTSIGNAMKSTAAVAGGFTAGIEFFKAIENGDSLGEGTSRIVSKTAESVVTAAASAAAAEAAFGGAATFLPGVGPILAAGGAAILINKAVGELTDGAFDEIGDGIGECVENIGDGIGEFVEEVGDGIGEFVEEVGNGVEEFAESVGDLISDTCFEIGCLFDSLFF